MKSIHIVSLLIFAGISNLAFGENEISPILNGKNELVAYLKNARIAFGKEVERKTYSPMSLEWEGSYDMKGFTDKEFVLLIEKISQKLRPAKQKNIISALVNLLFKGHHSNEQYQVTVEKEERPFFFGLFKQRINKSIVITNDPANFIEQK